MCAVICPASTISSVTDLRTRLTVCVRLPTVAYSCSTSPATSLDTSAVSMRSQVMSIFPISEYTPFTVIPSPSSAEISSRALPAA